MIPLEWPIAFVSSRDANVCKGERSNREENRLLSVYHEEMKKVTNTVSAIRLLW
jgi:hypothetical protein